MTTYNTGNPIGSKDPRDLYDNAENLDEAVNTRTAESWDDRFGVARKTWWGMEQDFQQFLLDSGYVNIGDYGPGLEITERNQIFWRDGELYRAGAALELPYTTTGDWGSEEGLFVAVGDQALRQELISLSVGSSFLGRGVVSVETISALLSFPGDQRRVDLRYLVKEYESGSGVGGGEFYWLPDDSTEPDGGIVFAPNPSSPGRFVRNYSGNVFACFFGAIGDYYLPDGNINPSFTDNADAFDRIMAHLNKSDMQARTIEFPAGGFGTSKNFSITYPNRYIKGQGRNITRLLCTAGGVAFQFAGRNPNHGIYSIGGGAQGIGFRGNPNSSIILDVDFLQHCRFVDIDVAEASHITGFAYRVGGVVCGHFEDIVYSANATIMESPAYIGLMIELDYEGNVRPTGNTFVNVIIEGSAGDGCVLTDAENNTFIGGTIENNAGNNINIGPECRTNTWVGTAFESRETSYADVYDQGHMTKLINCYTSRWVRSAPPSLFFSVLGGVHGSFDLGGEYGTVEDIEYGFFGPGVFGAHPTTSVKNIYNKQTESLVFPKLMAAFGIPFSANPSAWTNNTGKLVQVVSAGSGVITYFREGSAIGESPVGGAIIVQPGDSIQITSSSGTPNISGIPLG